MGNRQHIGFWLGVVFIAFLLSPLLRSSEDMQSYALEEIAQIRGALGDEVGNRVVSFANALFDETPLGELAQTASNARHTRDERKLSYEVAGPLGELASVGLNGYLEGMMVQTYVVAMRGAIVLTWALILFPMLLAAVYDGLMARRVKREEFGVIRPATFSLTGALIIPLLCMPAVYLVLPMNVSPLLAPAWALLVALPLSLMVSNMQPIFGR